MLGVGTYIDIGPWLQRYGVAGGVCVGGGGGGQCRNRKSTEVRCKLVWGGGGKGGGGQCRNRETGRLKDYLYR